MTTDPTLTTQLEALPQWEALLNRVGWPIVIIALASYGAVKLCRWMAPRVDRVIEAHLKLLTKLGAKLERMDDRLEAVDVKLDKIIASKGAQQ